MRQFGRAILAVLSAFAGVRNSSAARPQGLRPHHYIIAGVLMVAVFVAILLTVVRAVV